jgi:hypothetical protein
MHCLSNHPSTYLPGGCRMVTLINEAIALIELTFNEPTHNT